MYVVGPDFFRKIIITGHQQIYIRERDQLCKLQIDAINWLPEVADTNTNWRQTVDSYDNSDITTIFIG